MQNTATTPALTALETAVLEVIAYGDLFDYALTPEEVQRWLPVPATLSDVESALVSQRLVPMLSVASPYVTLAGRESTAATREQRRHSSHALRRQARRYGGIIARMPFVRMVAITGALAVDNGDEGDDLDYLVVTAPGRVWLTRTMIMALGRVAALRGVTLCPNYLISESVLALPANDYYTARELLQMEPVSGHAVYERMLAANTWWRDHLPNAEPPAQSQKPDTPSILRRASEWVLRLPPFDAAERWVLSRKGAELRRDAGPEAVFDETMCKGHFDRWRERTQQRLKERMQQLLEVTP